MGSRHGMLPLALLSSALLVDPAWAALEEIVVTARKREERLQELPMSVTAIGADTIQKLGVRNLNDVTRYTPGVDLDSGFGLNDQRLVFRGLSPSRGRPNSAILVDGIDLTTESVSTAGGSMLFSTRLLDIERVEVVKGPQSALYGRAAFTGAIQYVTRDPSESTEGEVGFDVGDYGRRSLSASFSGPVLDDLGLRLNAVSWNEDGYYDEQFTDASLGGGEGYGVSLTGLWQAADTVSVRSRVAYSDDEFDQQATLFDPVNTLITPPASSLVLPNISDDTVVGLFAGSPDDADGRKPVLSPNPNTGRAYSGGEQDVLNFSLTVDWDVVGGTVTSYTGYVTADARQILDGDFDVRPDATNTQDIARGGTEIDFATDTRMFSQELRYASNLDGPVQFTVGALFWDEKVDQVERGYTALAFPFGVVGADPNYFNVVGREAARQNNLVDRDTESRSLYGLVEWDISAKWRVSVEARYAREEMNVTGAGCDPDQPFASFRCLFSTPDLASEFPPGSGLYTQLDRVYTSDSSSDYYVAPKATLEWLPTDDLLAYFSISQGIKPGGIATVASGTWLDQEPDGDLDELKFDEEKLLAYELGAKSTWLDGSLVLNGALFFQDYSDKQIPLQSISGGFPFTVIDNAGEAEVWGLELEAVWQIAEHWQAQLGYAWLDGEYTDLVYLTNSANSIARAGNCTPTPDANQCAISLSDNTLEDIPEHSLVGTLGYYPPLGDWNLDGLAELDVQYQDSRFTDEFNDREVDAYTLLNLRLGVQADSWDLLVYIDNLTDDDTVRSWSTGTGIVATAERTDPNLFAFPGEGFGIAPPPRHWGVRGNFRF